MNAQLVKSAEGRRVRNPRTGALLPNVGDADAKGVTVDLDDPYWFRAHEAGDIVPVDGNDAPAPTTPSVPAAAPPATASSATPASAAPATPAASVSTPAASSSPASKSA